MDTQYELYIKKCEKSGEDVVIAVTDSEKSHKEVCMCSQSCIENCDCNKIKTF